MVMFDDDSFDNDDDYFFLPRLPLVRDMNGMGNGWFGDEKELIKYSDKVNCSANLFSDTQIYVSSKKEMFDSIDPENTNVC
jgi:hypothetical protein